MTRLVLVRHGESNVTVRRVIGGPLTCDGLSDLGRSQAERLRERWAVAPEFEPAAIYSSSYPRAVETAELIREAFGDMPVDQVEGFGEQDPGPLCDGLTYDQYVAAYRPQGGEWYDDDPFSSWFPGGETVAAFQFRVGTTLRNVMDRHPDGTIVVVCHGGVVDAVFRQLMRTAPTGEFQLHTYNASITDFEHIEGPTWKLLRYNDHAHLTGLPAATERTG